MFQKRSNLGNKKIFRETDMKRNDVLNNNIV